eukprot:TRINITY_DN9166_c0_g1_i1.p1 TRINITY_DN9166_c0_g1~~TRINITY_DN9166_c0_g1_i1.p1  ORF type:complete len:214 (+),score=88.97 TRINITY_DN9166_c0_g1_i1:55-696(+)
MRLSIVVLVLMVVLAVWVETVAADDDEFEDEPAPPSDAEVKKMKVKDLKGWMANRGLVCGDCFEKNDFVKFVKANREAKLLPSKRKRKVSKEPIDKQWKKVVEDVCQEENVDEKTCKPLVKVVGGSFEMHGRRVSKQLHKDIGDLAKTTFSEPYVAAGTKLIRDTLKWMVKTSTTSQDPIRKKIDNEIKMYLTAAGADNVNPMYEILHSKDEL